jgi:hypothetical protein
MVIAFSHLLKQVHPKIKLRLRGEIIPFSLLSGTAVYYNGKNISSNTIHSREFQEVLSA